MSVFVIAEAGINWAGDIARAHEMIRVARACGADAVKFQSFDVEKLGYHDHALNALLRTCQLTRVQHAALKVAADDCGIEFMSTPFDLENLAMLVRLGVKRIKISSGKATDEALIEAAALTKLPIIISDGKADKFQMGKAMGNCVKFGTKDVTALYCVSEYPTPLHKIDLRQMLFYERYCKFGFSDHTAGTEASIIAAASGAQVIEKHFTLDRSLPGPDQCCSLEPHELAHMVAEIRRVA